MDEVPRSTRSHRRSRSRHRSRSQSPFLSTTPTDNNNNNNNNQKQTQFIPIPVPYYQPQVQPSQPGPVTSTNTNSQPISYIIPQAKQQFVDDNNQLVNISFFLFSFSFEKYSFRLDESHEYVQIQWWTTIGLSIESDSTCLYDSISTQY
jgi:hypothetical protein